MSSQTPGGWPEPHRPGVPRCPRSPGQSLSLEGGTEPGGQSWLPVTRAAGAWDGASCWCEQKPPAYLPPVCGRLSFLTRVTRAGGPPHCRGSQHTGGICSSRVLGLLHKVCSEESTDLSPLLPRAQHLPVPSSRGGGKDRCVTPGRGRKAHLPSAASVSLSDRLAGYGHRPA